MTKYSTAAFKQLYLNKKGALPSVLVFVVEVEVCVVIGKRALRRGGRLAGTQTLVK